MSLLTAPLPGGPAQRWRLSVMWPWQTREVPACPEGSEPQQLPPCPLHREEREPLSLQSQRDRAAAQDPAFPLKGGAGV